MDGKSKPENADAARLTFFSIGGCGLVSIPSGMSDKKASELLAAQRNMRRVQRNVIAAVETEKASDVSVQPISDCSRGQTQPSFWRNLLKLIK